MDEKPSPPLVGRFELKPAAEISSDETAKIVFGELEVSGLRGLRGIRGIGVVLIPPLGPGDSPAANVVVHVAYLII